MAVSEAWTLSLVDVNVTNMDVEIGQVQSWSPSPNITPLFLKGAGELQPTWLGQDVLAPVISFTTTEIATVLASLTLKGRKIDGTGVACYLKQLDEGGTRKTGANHMKLNVTEGMIIPRTISATDGGGAATLTCDIVTTYDGTNLPIVVSDSQSISATPTADEAYTAGPVNVNGTALSGVQSTNIDCGNQEVVLKGDGEISPTFVALMSHAPSATVVTAKTSILATLGIDGAVQSGTDSIIYLRKMAEGGGRVADATEEHIKLTMDHGGIFPGPTNFALDAAGFATLTLLATFDNSNDPFVLSTASAIT